MHGNYLNATVERKEITAVFASGGIMVTTVTSYEMAYSLLANLP